MRYIYLNSAGILENVVYTYQYSHRAILTLDRVEKNVQVNKSRADAGRNFSSVKYRKNVIICCYLKRMERF